MNLLVTPRARTLALLLSGSLVLALSADIAMQMLLRRGAVDAGSYYSSWNSSSAASIEGFHGALLESGGFPDYIRAHLFDYVFQVGLLGASVSALILLARGQKTSDAARSRILLLCVLPVAVYLADVIETSLIVSSLHDPLHVSGAVAAAHPIAFNVMMVLFTLEAVAILTLSIVRVAVKAAERAKRARGAGIP
jgi:hypothetical protein